jgi:hypothetical protein
MKPLTVWVMDQGAPEDCPPDQNFIRWEPSVPSGSVGIGDVARLMNEFRGYIRQLRGERKRSITTLGAISDDGLERLLRHAYQASFMTDEGRQVRGRVAVQYEHIDPQTESVLKPGTVGMALAVYSRHQFQIHQDGLLHAFRFPAAISLDKPKTIAKLAPILARVDGAISVKEQGGELVITGIAQFDHESSDYHLLRMPGLWEPRAGVLIEILGPGHLRIREAEAKFTLFADRLVSLRWVVSEPLVDKLLCEVSEQLMQAFKADPSYSDMGNLFPDYEFAMSHKRRWSQQDVWIALCRILRAVLNAGHGGMVVFVPDADTPFLDIKHPLAPIDLRAELTELWRSHCTVWTAKGDERNPLIDIMENKRVRLYQWLRRLDSIGQLMAADGCAVFDRNLILHGFGGVINIDPARVASRTHCRVVGTDQEVPVEEVLKPFGTRHKSACALCQEIPNSVVFVVSQDRDLRMFASDENAVYFAENLHV